MTLDELRLKVKKAKVEYNLTYKIMSIQSGLNYQTLRNFISGGALGKDKSTILNRYLDSLSY